MSEPQLAFDSEKTIRKFGWQAETREQLLDRFIKSRPQSPSLSEAEIMKEVNAVRYKSPF